MVTKIAWWWWWSSNIKGQEEVISSTKSSLKSKNRLISIINSRNNPLDLLKQINYKTMVQFFQSVLVLYAIAVVLLCSAGLSDAQKRTPPSKSSPAVTPSPPHYFDSYPAERSPIKKVLDGAHSGLWMMSDTNTALVNNTLVCIFELLCMHECMLTARTN